MPKSTLKYTNGEITVVWKPDTCIHSRICWTELREVFDPSKRPWVNMAGSGTERIMEQVRKCPSGALSFFMNEADGNTDANGEPVITGETAEIMEIQIKPNGPILIKTDCHITLSDGTHTIQKGTTALCRCGGSANKPYCDGTHNHNGFTG